MLINEIKAKEVSGLGFIDFYLIPEEKKDFCFICGAPTRFQIGGDEAIFDDSEYENYLLPCCQDQFCYDLAIQILEEKSLAFCIACLSHQNQIMFEPDLDESNPDFCIAFDDDFNFDN